MPAVLVVAGKLVPAPPQYAKLLPSQPDPAAEPAPAVLLPDLVVVHFQADPSLALESPWNLRERRAHESVSAIVLHTTKGFPDETQRRPQTVNERPALPAECGARDTIAMWRRGGTFAGAHFVLDSDGVVYQCADPATDAAYHAGHVNGYTIGIEVSQRGDSSLYRAQLVALPALVGALSDLFALPRRVAMPYQGHARAGIESERGVFGHRDCDENRGFGDPGDYLPQCLVDAGWEKF